MTVHTIHVEPEPELQDAWERGYAAAWTARGTVTRPETCYIAVYARWGELELGATIQERLPENKVREWMVTRIEPLTGQPNARAVTITGVGVDQHGLRYLRTYSWPAKPGGPGKDVDERVWTLERVDIDEAQRIVTAQLQGHVLVRVNGDLPGQPADPGIRWRWRRSGNVDA